MSDLIRLSLTTVNAPDAIALARFCAEIAGGIAKGDECWRTDSSACGESWPLTAC